MTSIFTPGLRAITAVLSVTLPAACARLPAAGPDYQPARHTLPASWSMAPDTPPAAALPDVSAAAQGAALARWWQQLGDARLNRLIDEALAGSPDLRLAQARLRQARASRQQAVSELYPTLSASASASRNRNGNRNGTAGNAGLASSTGSDSYDAGFDASWEIDVFGGARRGVEAASADLAASRASLDNARVSLVAEVAQNYIDGQSLRNRIGIARDNLVSQTETLQITEWRYQAGLASSSDVEQARANREQTRAGIPDLEVSLVQARNRIALLLGRNPGSMPELFSVAGLLPAVPGAIATGIPADVLRQRPDLVAAERTLAAETARVGQKQAQRFPSLKLSGFFGWQAFSLGALGTSAALARSATGSLAATMFDASKLRSAVEVQSAVQEQALVNYQRSVLAALEDVENALSAYAAAHERLDARRGAAEAARNAAALSRQMYESGLSDFQKLLDTERTRLIAEDSLATAQAAQLTSLVRLYKALGGGWEPAAADAAH